MLSAIFLAIPVITAGLMLSMGIDMRRNYLLWGVLGLISLLFFWVPALVHGESGFESISFQPSTLGPVEDVELVLTVLTYQTAFLLLVLVGYCLRAPRTSIVPYAGSVRTGDLELIVIVCGVISLLGS